MLGRFDHRIRYAGLKRAGSSERSQVGLDSAFGLSFYGRKSGLGDIRMTPQGNREAAGERWRACLHEQMLSCIGIHPAPCPCATCSG